MLAIGCESEACGAGQLRALESTLGFVGDRQLDGRKVQVQTGYVARLSSQSLIPDQISTSTVLGNSSAHRASLLPMHPCSDLNLGGSCPAKWAGLP